jgi:adenylate cyclase
MTEIERKFLVKSEVFKQEAFKKSKIKQGYLNSHPERTTRIRVNDDKAYITIKGKSSESGVTRFEWEQEINVSDAEKLLELCERGSIDKMRYLVKYENHTFEVDEFFGENEGLFIAEIELNSEDEKFEIPSWLGEEVTGDNKYYNSQLCLHPYCKWEKN